MLLTYGHQHSPKTLCDDQITLHPADIMISKETSEATVDGVNRLNKNDISIVIIGAGVAGLQAALECWRKGCDVVVLERAEKLSALGKSAHLSR